MIRLLNIVLFEQTSAAHSERKSSSESLVRFFIHQSLSALCFYVSFGDKNLDEKS